MALNADVDALIVSAKAFALANTVPDGLGGQRPMTELEAIGIAAVRLSKRYAAQGAVVELPVLEAMLLRLHARATAFASVKVATEAGLITSNKATVDAALNAANPAE